jgi:hypothetical protein
MLVGAETVAVWITALGLAGTVILHAAGGA